nr:hypothetical protein [uncultured Flavobacterium sp.]
MNEILKIIETRELYSHLILSKVYISTHGRTNESYSGNLTSDVKKLFGDEFDLGMYNTATNFLYSEGYFNYPSCTHLTLSGRRYFENFIKNYKTLKQTDIELLQYKLPERIVDFLGISANIATIADFFVMLTKL